MRRTNPDRYNGNVQAHVAHVDDQAAPATPSGTGGCPQSDSPFAPVLGDCGDELPPAMRDQFLLPAVAPYRVVLDGVMDRVWRRRRWLWPLFWLLARADILFPETGEHVPASLTISPERDQQGRVGHAWRRVFRFPTERRFNAVMGYDDTLQRVVEWLGPRRLVQIVWHVQFRPPRTMEILTEGVELRLGRRRWRLPRWLTASVRAVERADAAREDAIHIELTVAHPLLGPLFGYEGTFRRQRLPLVPLDESPGTGGYQPRTPIGRGTDETVKLFWAGYLGPPETCSPPAPRQVSALAHLTHRSVEPRSGYV